MAVDLAKQLLYWRHGADEALATAELLISNGRLNFGLFFLHLALEKCLKALVVQQTRDLPPKTHDLIFLCERAALTPPQNVLAILGEFQAYCLIGRYPDSEPTIIPQQVADIEFVRAKEACTWLHQQFNK